MVARCRWKSMRKKVIHPWFWHAILNCSGLHVIMAKTVTGKSIRGSKTWMKLIILMGWKRYGQEEWRKKQRKNAILFNGTTEISGLDKMQNFIWFPRCNQNVVNLNVICTMNVMYALRHFSVLIAAGSWKISAHPLVFLENGFDETKKRDAHS